MSDVHNATDTINDLTSSTFGRFSRRISMSFNIRRQGTGGTVCGLCTPPFQYACYLLQSNLHQPTHVK